MADVLSFDLIEEILVRLKVIDLLRFKSVCKSWYSLILSPLFAKAHLNHTSNKDKVNAHRRIVASSAALWRIIAQLMHIRYSRIVGSSNGLLCIFCDDEELVVVVNPATRVAQKLQKLTQKPKRALLCFGFGYDSSRDDYKVIAGFRKRKMTHFYLLSLESNVWKFIGEVNCKFINHRNGDILCHGSLNWLMKDQNKKKIILSFDLSKQEFKEILLPDNPMKYIGNRLGVYKECLCIYNDRSPSKNKWLLENWNVKESWKLMQYDCQILKHISQESYYFCGNDICFRLIEDYIAAPIFVESLVSPHRKRIDAKEEDQNVETTESGRQKRRKIGLES